VAPLLLATAGLVALGVAAAILRSFGPGYRIGRLLAVVPRVSVAEAIQLADEGRPAYVRLDGRIDSDAEFEDADHRPLVLRRTTIAWRPAAATGAWTTFDTRLEVVPFAVREGLDEIAVGAGPIAGGSGSIAEGLVVVPRESVGDARDVDGLTAAGLDPGAQARVRVELVSTVDHATVLGVPTRAADGQVSIGAGLGRPLVISTLEDDEAMRVLAGGSTRRSRLAIACLAGGSALIGVAILWWLADAVLGGSVATALAASPDPTLRPGSDTRTSGGGPGIVGEPLLALLGVLGVALASLVATLAYVRLSSGRPRPR
jgi:hypothetical protein